MITPGNSRTLLAVVILLALCSNQIIAQVDKYVDQVKLHNGSSIWGLSEIRQEQVIVFVSEEDSIIIPAENIKSLKTGKLNPEWYQNRVDRFYYHISTGVLVGSSYQFSGNESSFSASFTSGYKLKRLLGLGLGAGVDFYPLQRHVPFFLDIQGDLLPGRVTPFYQLNAGYSWAEGRNMPAEVERLEGGFYLKPSVGVKWHFARYSWHLQLSYLRQESITYYEPIDFGNGNILTNVEERVLQRLGISVGISL